jgi:hypothetical protein
LGVRGKFASFFFSALPCGNWAIFAAIIARWLSVGCRRLEARREDESQRILAGEFARRRFDAGEGRGGGTIALARKAPPDPFPRAAASARPKAPADPFPRANISVEDLVFVERDRRAEPGLFDVFRQAGEVGGIHERESFGVRMGVHGDDEW